MGNVWSEQLEDNYLSREPGVMRIQKEESWTLGRTYVKKSCRSILKSAISVLILLMKTG